MTDDRLFALFERMCSLNDADREVLMQDLASESPTLAADLAELISADESVGGPMPRAIASLDGPSSTRSLLEVLATRGIGAKRYDIREEIGRGGMGVVFEAWDDALGRSLALKVMRDPVEGGERGSPGARRLDRFLEEAQITGQLQHPGIVPVYEMGIDERGRVFFAMQRVDGRTLKDVYRDVVDEREGWTLTRVLGVLQKVCETMAYAHSRGVVHRDLKPANIMVGRFGEVYVMDWGLARVLSSIDEHAGAGRTGIVATVRQSLQGSKVGSDGLQTGDGAIVGTPSYMAPEQARGESATIGTATDVYSVGAMLYEFLFGRTPLESPANPENELASARGIPTELLAICGRAMAARPSDRYQDMSVLAADIAAYLEDRVVLAHRTGPWAEAKSWVRRNKPVAVLSAIIVIVLVGAGALVSGHQYQVGLERVPRFADSLIAGAREGWPVTPASVASMNAWLADAHDVLAGVESERGEYEEWWDAPLLVPIEESVERNDGYQALAGKMSGIEGELERMRADPTANARDIDILNQELEYTIHRRDRLRDELLFEAPRVAWVDRPGIVERASRVRELETVWVPRVEQSLAAAKTLAHRSIGEHASAWALTIERIAQSEVYGDIRIVPQVGLVPLGVDEASGLFEFSHILSGEIPTRADSGELMITDASSLVFVLVPERETWIGAQDESEESPLFDPDARHSEKPVTLVRLDAFFVSKYEMTQGQWIRLTGRNPCMYASGRQVISREDGKAGYVRVSRLHPVSDISWVDATRFLRRWNLVLPTEAQWEYTARSGTTSRFWWGDAGPQANFADAMFAKYVRRDSLTPTYDDGYGFTAPVTAFGPNAFGIYNVAGNIKEWCRDAAGMDYGDAVIVGGQGEMVVPHPIGRSVRGGGWRDSLASMRVAGRVPLAESAADNDIGVRPVMVLQEGDS